MLSRPVLGAAITATLGLVLAGTFDIHNIDTFGHLAQGRQIAELGYVPSVDTFSFWQDTPQPWRNYEWGSDMLFWLVFSALGAPGLLALKGVLLAGVAALLLRRAADPPGARNLAVLTTAALILWAIPAARFRLTMRPELFGYFFSAVYLLGLSRLATGHLPRKSRLGCMAGLVGCHVLWVNLHGSHLLGVALAGAHLLPALRNRAARRDLILVLVGFGVASCISPFGPAIVIDAVNHVADPAYRGLVREWLPWSSNDPVFFLVALVTQTLLLAASAIALYRGDRADQGALVATVFLAALGFHSIRFVATFLLLSSPLIATGLARIAPSRVREAPKAFVFAALTLSAALTLWLTSLMPPPRGVGIGIDQSGLPVAAARTLEEDLPGSRLLAPIHTSWYLMFAAPSARLLVDGRVPFYGAPHITEVRDAFFNPPLLARLLERHRIDAVVLDFSSSGTQAAIATLAGTEGYYPISIENHHVLFAAFTPGREALFQRRAFRVLPPRLDADPLLADNAPVAAMHAEIARLGQSPETAAIRAWYEGVLALRALRRGGGAGFRAPDTEASRALAEEASRNLDRAARQYPLVPLVHSYRALAAVAACHPDTARAAIEDSLLDGENREASIATVEMALRLGDEGPARDLLGAAEDEPALAGDPWLAALGRDLEAGVRCTPTASAVW